MKIFLIVFLIIIIIYLLVTFIMFLLVSKKFNNELLPMSKGLNEILKPYQSIIDKGSKWVSDKIINDETSDLYIKSKDGLKLHGLFIENKKSKGIILEVHGYRSTCERDL